jgi:two-component system, cell cycle sensor histidine kinase and response regulator CckA
MIKPDDELLRRTLERNKKLLSQFIENTPAPIAMLDREMKYLMTSHRFLTDYHLKFQDLIGRSHYEVFPEIPEKLKEIHRRCLAGAVERSTEDPFPRQDGSLDWVRWEVHPWYEVNGEIGGIILFSEVITERKKLEETLRENEQRFRSLFQNNHAVMLIINPEDGAIIDANPAACSYYGYSKESLLSMNIGDINTLSSSQIRDEMNQAQANRRNRFEFRHRLASGEVRDVEVYSGPIQINQQNSLYSLVFDITERRQAEESIRKSNRIWNNTFNAISDSICVISGAHDFLKINAAGCKALGLSENEIIGRKCYELVHGTTAPIKDCPCDLTMKTRSPSIWEHQERGRFYELGAWPVLDAAGNIESVTHIVRDITGRKKQEIEYKQLIDGMNDTVYVIDFDAKFMDVNDAAVKTLEYSRSELLAMGPADIDPFFSSDEIGKLIEGKQSDERKVFETQHKTKHGKIIPVEISASGVTYQGKLAMLCIARDITERKRAEKEQEKLQAQFIQAQKMESVGRLAGGVAHDYNNILGVIIGYTELALEKLSPEDSLYEDLKQIYAAAGHSRDITRQLLAFARKETIAPEVLDLNSTVESMLKILRRLIGEDINLEWLPGSGLWPVLMDPTQIDQMLANLCVNARDAIVSNGKIIIETNKATFDQAFCDSHAGSLPGDFVMLAVSDDGSGMDRKTLNNIFEPFFTTKGVGKGTGLGLATVYGIVKQNNGYIDVYSEPGQGSVFKIYLPRHIAPIAEIRQQAAETVPGGKGETLLVVEDDIAILRLVEKILKHRNYNVLSAQTPCEALQLAEAHSEKIDLLITDVVMPEMSGRELAAQLQQICPGLRCLYMSGYTADVIAHRGVLDKDIQFIQKPFSVESLAGKVRAALDRQ